MRAVLKSTLLACAVASLTGATAAPGRPGAVALDGHALRDGGGHFLGLGASYFQALRRTKFDRPRYRSDLEFLSGCGINYIRTLSMVGWNESWAGLEIVPTTTRSRNGRPLTGWDDYGKQLRAMIDIAYDDFGIRTQLTIFADAQMMPDRDDRIAHLNRVLEAVAGREHKVMLLEVANEAWQNGFPDDEGVAQLREFGKFIADRTPVMVALSSTNEPSQKALERLYGGSAADIATEHFTRDLGTPESGWLPVRDVFRVHLAAGVPPVSSNEPIGPGSSVAKENDPIKLVCAAAYAWMSGLPMYVFHSGAGVHGDTRFQDMPGINAYRHLPGILPGNVANWRRTEGKDDFAPFITRAGQQPNKWWTEVAGADDGVVRHLSAVQGDDFRTLPIGIRPRGVELEARRPMSIEVIHPLTGEVAHRKRLAAGERFTLEQGPGAYLIRGRHDRPSR